jgi:CO/xanthine dehydrogenase Mo-binding subunit
VEAARLAKITGKPVQVVWDRAEEFFFDSFRPAAVVKIRAGLTAAGKIAFWDYAVVGNRNFDSYELPRFSWVPKIETILIENQETPASGCGEPPMINVAAVLANAIFDAAGVRMPQLPMTPARVLAALKKA